MRSDGDSFGVDGVNVESRDEDNILDQINARQYSWTFIVKFKTCKVVEDRIML